MAPPPPQLNASTDATLLPSDSEDEDFNLSEGDDDGGSDSSDSEAGDRPAKRSKLDHDQIAEPVLSKDDVDDLWASFNAPAASTSTSSATIPARITAVPPKSKETMKIKVAYKFAGKWEVQEKEVLVDSEEARNWLNRVPAEWETLTDDSEASRRIEIAQPNTSLWNEAERGDASKSSSSSSAVASEAPIVSKPTPPPPQPRRAKGGLAAMSAALKAPKLNTLEKSKLDWNKFVAKEDLGDDLTKARKDGYLEKQDFLKRTEDRREDDYDKSKSLRRR